MYKKVKGLLISFMTYAGLMCIVLSFSFICYFNFIKGNVKVLFGGSNSVSLVPNTSIANINSNYVYLDKYSHNVGISFFSVKSVLAMLYSTFGIVGINYVEKVCTDMDFCMSLYMNGDNITIVETNAGISSVSVKTDDEEVLERVECIMNSSRNDTNYRFKVTSNGFVLEC